MKIQFNLANLDAETKTVHKINQDELHYSQNLIEGIIDHNTKL
tara:strand:- start:608 stop:736 length:129 start_codon:yes stop_codon:yes gene_type:complete